VAQKRTNRSKSVAKRLFNTQEFLDSVGVARKVTEFKKQETIFSQGDPCRGVFYIQKGGVRLSVVNESGKEAVVAVLGPGDFFGEGCLAGQPTRIGTSLLPPRWSSKNPKWFASSIPNMSFPIFHIVYAGEEYPNRGRPGRSALQF
jgi:CRP-like cAMP-binding protein